MSDRYPGDAVLAPSRTAFAVSKSDTTDFLDSGVVPKALYVGDAGDIVVTMVDDSTDVTFKNVASGTILPIRVRKVKAATTAANIVGMC